MNRDEVVSLIREIVKEEIEEHLQEWHYSREEES